MTRESNRGKATAEFTEIAEIFIQKTPRSLRPLRLLCSNVSNQARRRCQYVSSLYPNRLRRSIENISHAPWTFLSTMST
jgi:hypothetical protein